MPKENCPYCKFLEAPEHVLLENEHAIAFFHERPAVYGHILVMPKEHYPILEQVPDYVIAKIFQMANRLSIAAFETLQVQGTNAVINNGIAAGQQAAHVLLHVIPRREGDSLNFQWQPKQISDEEMGMTELKLKEETKSIGGFEKEAEKPRVIGDTEEKMPEKKGRNANLIMKHIRRIP